MHHSHEVEMLIFVCLLILIMQVTRKPGGRGQDILSISMAP
jgi:hypothetical protein